MKRFTLAAISLIAFTMFASENPPKVAPEDQPQYNASGELQLPKNYRDWVFLSSGLGMDYSKTERDMAGVKPEDEPTFDTVFVSPSAYRAFLQTGAWPDKTMFALEVRSGESHVSINHSGFTQGKLFSIASAVKDESRFKEK